MTEGEQRMSKALEAAHWRIKELERENAELESKLAKAEHDLFHAGMKSQDNPDDYVMQY
jgi:hypothetical protein